MRESELQRISYLYEQYKTVLFRYLQKEYDRLRLDDIQDILQDIWISLTECIEEVEKLEPKQQASWLYTAAQYRAKNMLKKKSYAAEVLMPYEELTEYKSGERPLFDAVADRLAAGGILMSLDSLERKLLLARFRGIPFSRIEAEECSAHALECKYSRLMKKLEKRMNEEGIL